MTGAEHAQFGSTCMRIAFLAADRPDIAFTSKEAARAMATRTDTAVASLKRQVRYLSGARRLLWVYYRQRLPKRLIVYSDANYAGCVTTRKSTSCCAVNCLSLIRQTKRTHQDFDVTRIGFPFNAFTCTARRRLPSHGSIQDSSRCVVRIITKLIWT